MRKLIVPAIVLVSVVASAQSTPTDSQNLRALLEEARQLRRDLQTTTVAAQRVQIALYGLQLQDAAVARATKLVDDARSRLNALATEHKRVVTDIEQVEDQRSRTQDPRERRVIEEEALPQLKKHLQQIANDEEQWQAKAGDAEGQLKAEQMKLDTLHSVLDQLDQSLRSVGLGSANAALPPR